MFKRAWTDSDMLICWYMLIYVDTINKSGCFSWSYPFIPRFGGMNIPETETIFELQGTVLFSGFDTENHTRVFATRVQFQQAQFHWELG